MDLRQAWEKEFKAILERFGPTNLTKLLGERCSLHRTDDSVQLNFKALDFDIAMKYDVNKGNLDMSYETKVGSERDLSHILFLHGKMLNRRLKLGAVDKEPGFVGIIELPGGIGAKAYENRVRSYLINEMEGSTKDEMKRISEIMGGSLDESSKADWAIETEPINGVRIMILYWNSEEELPGSASIIYGAEISKINLPMEDIKALTEIFVKRLVDCYRKVTGRSPKKWASLYR